MSETSLFHFFAIAMCNAAAFPRKPIHLRGGGVFGKLGFSGTGELGAELALQLANNLGIRNRLSTLVLGQDLGLFVNGGGQLLLGHFFCRSGLLDGAAQILVDLGNGSDIGGFFQLHIRREDASYPSFGGIEKFDNVNIINGNRARRASGKFC